MAATVSEITAAMKRALTAVEGLRISEWIPDQVNPPHATISLDGIDYHRSFAMGAPEHRFTVSVIVGRASERAAQLRLDSYLSATGDYSIRQALEDDQTLAGVVQSLIVTAASGIQIVTISDVVYLSVDFSVTCYA